MILKIEDYWTYPRNYEIADSWWKAHGLPFKFTENTLPKLAIFVTDDGLPVCLLACDMSNSIGKATLESGLTAPGLTAGDARRFLQFAEFAIFSALKPNYGLVQTFTSPALARTLEKTGWTRIGDVVHLIKEVT